MASSMARFCNVSSSSETLLLSSGHPNCYLTPSLSSQQVFVHQMRSRQSFVPFKSTHCVSRQSACRMYVCFAISPAFKPGTRVETDFLPSDVRERTMKAVDELGGRVTVGDVSSRAGIKITQADTALQALATDSGGFLEVSDEGDVLYVFPKDYRVILATKSFRLKVEPLLTKLKAAANYLIRVAFGTTLVASIVLVYSTIFAVLTSSRSENDSQSRNQRSRNSGFTFYISPADLFWYWDPYYYRRKRIKPGGLLNFFESVFSFVFGDGDPNEGREELRWKMIGEYIKSKGGVVCAEELAPYVDAPLLEENSDVEALMLPVLLRFDGEPEVDRLGNIVYCFPSFQRTALLSWKRNTFTEIVPFEENRWQFSKASKDDLVLVVGLGVINLIGILILSSWSRNAAFLGSLAPFVSKVLPILQLYTLSFFGIPAARWFLLEKRNAEIEKKNAARVQWLAHLRRPDLPLQKKLESTWNLSKKKVIGPDQIIYTTEKDLVDQDYEAQDWEQRFRNTRSK